MPIEIKEKIYNFYIYNQVNVKEMLCFEINVFDFINYNLQYNILNTTMLMKEIEFLFPKLYQNKDIIETAYYCLKKRNCYCLDCDRFTNYFNKSNDAFCKWILNNQLKTNMIEHIKEI